MEKNNIFEGAKFGDRFVTRNGELAIFVYRAHCGWLEFIYQPKGCVYSVLTTTYGGHWLENEENDLDVVAKYIESIDEEELNREALEYSDSRYGISDKHDLENAFKAGYRKAMEE